MVKKDDATREGRAPVGPSRAKLPPHIGSLKLPSGKTLAELDGTGIARLCIAAGIPGASHEMGRQELGEMLISTLETIGKQASERAIQAWLSQTFGDKA